MKHFLHQLEFTLFIKELHTQSDPDAVEADFGNR